MALNTNERAFLQTLSNLAYCNPFLPRRIELEREALGPAFIEAEAEWNLHPDLREDSPNLLLLTQKTRSVLMPIATRQHPGSTFNLQEQRLYEDGVHFLIYHEFLASFNELIDSARSAKPKVPFFDRFQKEAARWFDIPGYTLPSMVELPHIFACLFQIRRAFYHTFSYIIGASKPAIRLRAQVWQSIFTHDMRRYRRTLFQSMGDITTLITGPSGTGKELVARAVGLSRYVPLDATTRTFSAAFGNSFFPLNLSAMSPTLIESELFGHRRGAFTGAVEDRVGWLEVCPITGAVFLDEIGELDPTIQVKLLRVIQTRVFQRLGESKDRQFLGKIITATNRDLAHEIRESRFREDLYYRLCADIIQTPSLRDRISDYPDELTHLLDHLCRRDFGSEGDPIASDVAEWIKGNLGAAYPWPGNVRELEQCVRNVVIHGHYEPFTLAKPGSLNAGTTGKDLLAGFDSGQWTAEELLQHYCRHVFNQTGSYSQTASRLGLDRRTVKARIQGET